MAPRLIIETASGAVVHALEPGKITSLGRNRANTIVLEDKHSSRWHSEVLYENGKWLVRDCDTMNGTRLNQQKIRRPTPLKDGDEIRIGDTRVRFAQDALGNEAPTSESKAINTPVPPNLAAGLGLEKTAFQQDELNVLCAFMAGSVEEASPRALVARALAVIHHQTEATVTGFLSLDEEEPLPKMVLPELSHVDIHLSRQLTHEVQREGRLVWMGGQNGGPLESESMLSFSDAVCIPLRADEATLGAIHVYKAGSKHFNEREVRFCEVLAGYLANSLHVLRSRRQLEAENSRLRGHRTTGDDELIGGSLPMKKLRQQISKIAPRQTMVLVMGESGVGKELVALALHRQSQRRDAPLVTVNCAAFASNLMESELFGHRKGAFTTALADRKGVFEQADEGTLFLDEIGELSPECQAKLLRVLEGKGFHPVGAEAEIKVDVRIVAATNRDLEAEVQHGKFREDLFFRLGIPIHVPPLRERADDIPALVSFFLGRLGQEFRRLVQLTPAALDLLREYSWPGNVRQLHSVLEHAVAMTEGHTIDANDLRLTSPRTSSVDGPPSLRLEEVEAWAIRRALQRKRYNLSQTAKALGIHRDTLAMKMKKYGIEKAEV